MTTPLDGFGVNLADVPLPKKRNTHHWKAIAKAAHQVVKERQAEIDALQQELDIAGTQLLDHLREGTVCRKRVRRYQLAAWGSAACALICAVVLAWVRFK